MAQLQELLPAIVREVLAEAKKQEQADSFRNEPLVAENVRCIPLEADGFPVLLPPPRMDGKKCVDPRTKLGGTVLDARLAKLLEEHRLSRGVQLSRIFDTALWYYLGQPELGEEEQPGGGEPKAEETENQQAV